MWELDHKESWVPKNWCCWTVVLKKTLESLLDCKEIQPVHSMRLVLAVHWKNDDEAEAPILWPPDAKNWLIKKDPDTRKYWRQEKRMREDEMVWWYHRLNGPTNGQEFEQALGVVDGQERLAYCNPWGLKRVGHDWTTELNNWTELRTCILKTAQHWWNQRAK